MFSSFSNKAILTKARAMYGKRLTAENYADLLKKQSVSEIASYLKNNTHFSDSLTSINEIDIHRGQLENLLRKDLFKRYIRLCHYEYSKDKSFYYYIVMESEIDQILNCARFLDNELKEQFVLSMPSFLVKYCSFDLNRLIEVTSFNELISVLDTTQYKSLLTGLRPKPGEHMNITDFEIRLRNHYFKTIFDLINQYFTGKTRNELIEIFEIKAELSNINIIMRLKQFFSASPEYIRSCLIPINHKISKSLLDHLINAKDAKEAISMIKMKEINKVAPNNDPNFIEDLTNRLQYYSSLQLVRYSINAPTVLCSFMILSEIEIQNIINIIEGVRYDIAFSEIEKLLIL